MHQCHKSLRNNFDIWSEGSKHFQRPPEYSPQPGACGPTNAKLVVHGPTAQRCNSVQLFLQQTTETVLRNLVNAGVTSGRRIRGASHWLACVVNSPLALP